MALKKMASSSSAPSDTPSQIDGLQIIHLDDSFIAVNKPFGLRSVPAFAFKESEEAQGQPPKKRKRQERFSDVLESLGSYVSDSKGATPDDTSLQPYLGKLGKEHDSVPRKRNKFISYAKRSLKIEEDDVADRLFDFIEKRVKAEEEREGASLSDSVLTRIQNSVSMKAAAVHRLDMETSGLLLVALTREAGQELNRQFREREVSKTYLAVVENHVVEDEGTIVLPLNADVNDRPKQFVDEVNGKSAHTEWKVRARNGSSSFPLSSLPSSSSSGCNAPRELSTLLELNPLTGRTHQLRVHLQAIGHPIIGDTLYHPRYLERGISQPQEESGEASLDNEQRLMLHAEQIRFKHPTTGVQMELVAPAPSFAVYP